VQTGAAWAAAAGLLLHGPMLFNRNDRFVGASLRK
jgi:hypothetical protein